MNRLLPGETMRMVYSVLGDVLSSHRGTWLSFGMLGTMWTASAAFDSMIEALDIAYDVTSQRPMWKSRLLAIGLAGICGLLLLAALAMMVVGPFFGKCLPLVLLCRRRLSRFASVRWAPGLLYHSRR
jgi:membrane protein